MERLTPEMVLQGYTLGIFPMAHPDGQIYWYSPDPRTIFTYADFHVSHSLRQTLRTRRFDIRRNVSFREVMRRCADRAEGTWINDELSDLYLALHRAGFAHTVEAWRAGRLVGGLYGVTIGGAFFGESMFAAERDASKVTLVALLEHLQQRGYCLIDTQWTTPHLARLGVVEIPREAYLERLERALERECRFD